MSQKIHHCDNCGERFNQHKLTLCHICGDYYCAKCSEEFGRAILSKHKSSRMSRISKCHICNNFVCSGCVTDCDHCLDYICKINCTVMCDDNHTLCKDCFRECESCSKKVCSYCRAYTCDGTIKRSDGTIMTCGSHNDKFYCDECPVPNWCCYCGNWYCDRCVNESDYKNHVCESCDNSCFDCVKKCKNCNLLLCRACDTNIECCDESRCKSCDAKFSKIPSIKLK
jgi:hypothetical protein